mgnify:CR=1 FL=1
MILSIKKYLLRKLLCLIPPLSFVKINRWCFTQLGYKIHRSARISSNVKLLGNINLVVGKDTFIGHYTIIMGGDSSIKIGDNCDISTNVTIVSGTHILDPEGIRMAGTGIGQDISIGNGVWVGASSIIMPGVTLGDKSVVAAGSIVNKNVAPLTIVAGNPARPIKEYNKYTKLWEKCAK